MGPVGRGLAGMVAPHVAAEILTSHLKEVPIVEVVGMIDGDVILWELADEDGREKAKQLIREFGGSGWITIDWAMKAVKKELPILASLFLSSPKCYQWLEKQVEIIRFHIDSPP